LGLFIVKPKNKRLFSMENNRLCEYFI